MKIAKFITTFLLLFVLGMFISYANVIYNNWTNDFIEAFEQTDAKFKFYNIKINTVVPDIKSEEEIKQICIDIMNCFNISENQISWNIKGNEKEAQIYTKVKDNNYSITFTATQKNNKEYYIIIDILNNKVYKNIENIYTKLENELSEYSNDVDINVCIAGEYTKKLKKAKISDILQKILYNMYAEKISDIEEENFLSVNAYSKLLKENNLKYLDREINLNIGIRYSEDDDRTTIYMATPIIKIDY